MKAKTYVLVSTLAVAILFSCNRGKSTFEPPDSRPIQSIEIADAEEAALVQQQLGVEVQQIQGNRLYYFAVNKNTDEKLKEIGYTIRKENSMQLYYQYVQVTFKDKAPDSSKTEELKKAGVLIINKEEKFWIIRGTLEQLKQLEKMGYTLKKLDKEPRPREVEITVTNESAIQKINETGVDIYSVEKKKDSYTVYGGAFDYQIEKIQEMGFSVTRKN
jgi:hypothetical protein